MIQNFHGLSVGSGLGSNTDVKAMRLAQLYSKRPLSMGWMSWRREKQWRRVKEVEVKPENAFQVPFAFEFTAYFPAFLSRHLGIPGAITENAYHITAWACLSYQVWRPNEVFCARHLLRRLRLPISLLFLCKRLAVGLELWNVFLRDDFLRSSHQPDKPQCLWSISWLPPLGWRPWQYRMDRRGCSTI